MTELRTYQKNAIESLEAKVERVLRSSEDGVIVFQAPTGSGKTLVVSRLLKQLVLNRKDDKKFSFVWVSVRMLHEQSKEKLEKYYEDDGLLQCSYFDDLTDKRIGENEILFINWHSINKKDINIYVRENEQDNNLNSIIQNTKEDGREIILIIDESHHTASSEKSRELILTISPKVTLEVSATPHLKENLSEFEKITLAEVKAEEMIKSEIAVNPEFLNLTVGPKSSDEIVIEQALKKRLELKKLFEKEGSKINPLVLVQLPDQKGTLIDKKRDIEEILKKQGITEEDGKMAIWLSEEKTDTLVNVTKNDNEVEVLVFKQAIALGWDCPRASILAIFRESTSFVFTIQTIGRIMRMPELKYYGEEELNKGFVFTNLIKIDIAEDYAKDYITTSEAKRDNILYKEIKIPSVYLKRQRARTRLSGEFPKIFNQIAKQLALKKKITISPSKISDAIIADGVIVNIDQAGEIEHKGSIAIHLSEAELQKRFDKFITGNCSPFSPSDSSDRLKTALYQFLSQEFQLKKFDSQSQRVVLGVENVQFFVDTINLAKEKYKRDVVEPLSEVREQVINPAWEVPVIISYNERFAKENKPKSIMKPFYTKKQSEPEQLFIEALEKSSRVKWWFKNGESEIKYFAVLRSDGNGAFYPDFIVQFDDGSIGIFDTKSGRTAETSDAGPRAEGLQAYIREQKSQERQIWGGIAVNIGGSWRYNFNKKYVYNEDDLTSWKLLPF